MVPTTPRTQYNSDGKAMWSRLPAATAASLVAAVGMGWLFRLVYRLGFYIFAAIPALGSVALVIVLRGAIGWARCRNRLIAGVLGSVVGLTTYASYYEFRMRDVLPPGVGWRLDLLPQFVWHCIKTDRILSSHEIGKQLRPRQLAHELFPVSSRSGNHRRSHAAGAIKRAAWAYCIELDQWMRRETALAGISGRRSSTRWVRADSSNLSSKRLRAGTRGLCCRLTLEYAAPPSGATLDYPVYGTLTDVSHGK